MIQIKCSTCGLEFQGKDEWAGRKVKCKCGVVLSVGQVKPPQVSAPAQLQNCANCKRQIGALERVFQYSKHVVCSQCYAVLVPPTVSYQQPVASVTSTPPIVVEATSKRWKMHQLIGFGILILGAIVYYFLADMRSNSDKLFERPLPQILLT